MPIILEGSSRVVVVTGASSGIGREISREMCSRGYKVVGIGRRRDRLEELSRELRGRFEYRVADLSRGSEVLRLAEEIAKVAGHVDVLINNAGFGLYKRVLDHDLEELYSTIEVNMVSPVALTKLLLPLMGRGSAVVFVITAGVHFFMKRLPVYGAAKLGLHYMVRSLRRELGERGVRVIAVYPGYTNTEFHVKGGGEVHGKGMSPKETAKIIADGIERGKRVIYVPPSLGVLRVLLPLFLPPI
ncbi:MAG: SDR family NAD(P)-dependent oxidoreductase [Fervidicoccaceae archaeon]